MSDLGCCGLEHHSRVNKARGAQIHWGHSLKESIWGCYTIETNVSKRMLDVVGFVVGLINNTTFVNVAVFNRFVELGNGRGDAENFGYFWPYILILEACAGGRTRISQRVTIDSQRVDLLMEDRIAHQETIQIVEEEAYASREAWAHAIGLSQAVHFELQTHREQVYAHESQLHAHQTQLQLQGTLIQTQHQVHETRFQMQQAEMAALRETDRRRQAQMAETLRVMRDMRREMSDMQAELLAHREQQRRARKPGSDVRAPDHQEASRDTDSHI
ncbi:hypothetical protein Tco_0530407 [Tanacetum coccineum]